MSPSHKEDKSSEQIRELISKANKLEPSERAILYKREFYDPDPIKTRDYGFAPSDIRHWGQRQPIASSNENDSQGLENASQDSVERNRYTGTVRALYDFTGENPTELSFKKGDELYVHYRQCEGWLVGFFKDEKLGLIPENYVEFIRDEE